jgi:hypothetical protein
MRRVHLYFNIFSVEMMVHYLLPAHEYIGSEMVHDFGAAVLLGTRPLGMSIGGCKIRHKIRFFLLGHHLLHHEGKD